jgi:HlyD family secretion protein
MKRIVVILLAAAAMAAAWFLRPPAVVTQAKEAAAVEAKSPANTPTQQSVVVAPGRVEPASEEVAVTSEMDGRLASVLVEEGDTVRKGQILATLSSADFAARVTLAERAIDEKRAEFDRLRNGSRTQEKREATALVNEARAVMEQARTEWDRRRALLEKGAIARVEMESAERDFRVAEARVEAANERSSLVNAGTREEEIRQVEAEIATAEARVVEARASLSKTNVVSPMQGVVLRKHKHAGEGVNTDSPVVTLGDTAHLRVRVEVDETDVGRVKEGQRVAVKAAAFGDRTFSGIVTRVGRILGRKNVRTDSPAERVDTKILEVLVDLDPGTDLPIGLRVDAFIGA